MNTNLFQSDIRVLIVLAAGGLTMIGAEGIAAALPKPLPVPRQLPVRRAADSAKLDFPAGMRHDFGKIWDHTRVSHRFQFINNGDGPVSITDAQTSCGCTVSSIEDGDGKVMKPGQRIFGPGESGYVTAEFDPKRRSGVQIKPIRLFLNGATTPQYSLEIRSTVEQIIEQNPSIVYFRGVEKFGERPTMDLELIGRAAEFDASILSVEQDAEEFTVEKIGVERKEDVDGEPRVGVKYRVTVLEGVRQGVLRSLVKFKTTDPRAEEVSVPLSAQVLGDLTSNPARLSMGKIEPGSTVATSFVISSKTSRPFEVEGVSITGPMSDAEVTIEPVDADKRDAYTVTIGKIAGREPRQNGVVTVKTNISDEPRLDLSYFGWVASGPKGGHPDAVKQKQLTTPMRAGRGAPAIKQEADVSKEEGRENRPNMSPK